MDKYVGKRLDGRYEIKEIIGVGGMAVVYKAYDTIGDRPVAIKILKEELLQNGEFRRRFKNECKAIAVLSHPNIVKVYDVSLGDRIQYIVMEHIDGITLKEYISSQQNIGWKDALHFAEQVLHALQHAHDKGIVHRDIKPQNMMLLPDGTIKVTDFGIARFSRSEHRTLTDKAIGSVHYISPEQARGEVTDEKTDLYSVGVLLYEMLTGRLPFDAESAVSVAIMQLQNDPVNPRRINPAIPEGLEEIILRAMQKNPAGRYQSAAEMLKDIEKFKQNPSVQFEYKYFVDSEPTKFVSVGEAHTNEAAVAETKAQEKKSSLFPILLGVGGAIALVLVIVAVTFVGKMFNWFGSSGSAVDCPDLIGKVYNEVITDEAYKEYTIIMDDSKTYSEEYPAGQIMEQVPAAGKPLKGKKEITVKVSLGPKNQTMIDYVNMAVVSVTGDLDNKGIPYTEKEVFSDQIAAGFVVATEPAEGQTVTASTNVVIYVSKGAPTKTVKVGDYVGMEQDVAKRLIEGDGLTVGVIKTEESTQYDEGFVISQGIPEGTEVSSGEPITLVVSSGRSVVLYMPVPDDAQKDFTATVFYNGKQIYSSGSVNPSALTVGASGQRELKIPLNKNLASFASNVVDVRVQYSGSNYIDYKISFATGQYSKVNVYSLPTGVLYDQASVEPEVSSVPDASQAESQP